MSRALLRVAAVITALFAVGHSVGATHPPTRGALGAVVQAMKAVRFDLRGSERSYWDMFEGYGYLFIAVAAFLAVLLWLLSSLPRETMRPLALLTAALLAIISAGSFRYFFWAPGLFNAVAAACTVAAALL